VVNIPDLSLVMNDEGVPSASQRLNFRSCHNLPEWLRSIQSWRGYIPGYEISALIDADDEEPCAAVKSGSMDDRDNVADKRNPAPIRVCVGLPCALAGAEAFCDEITSARSGHRVIRETCMARCWMAPVAAIGDDVISGAIDGGTVNADSDGQAADSSQETFSSYTNAGGYGVLKSCLAKRRSIESIVSALSALPLASFEGEKLSIGIRMRELRDTGDVAKLLLLVDDAPPGVMSQTYLIERHTHSVLEGLLITALIIGAPEILVHCNNRYSSLRCSLERELTVLSAYGFDRHVSFTFSEFSPDTHSDDVHLLQSLCRSSLQRRAGETQRCEAASLTPASVLLVRPELLRWIPEILSMGIDSFCGQDGDVDGAPMLYSIAGRVISPGVYKAAAGRTVDELVAMAGGIENGHDFDSFIAGEWSNTALPSHLGSVRVDCETEGSTHPGRSVPIVVISSRDHVPRACAFRTDLVSRDRRKPNHAPGGK